MTTTMTMSNISTFAILSFLLCVGDGRVVEAFQQSKSQSHPRHPSQPPQLSRTTTTTTLQLQEGQGQFLKAAYECSTCAKVVVEAEDTAARLHLHTEDEYTHLPTNNDDDDDGASHSKWRAVASSKSFLTRVFHKKSVPHPILDAPTTTETTTAPPKFSVASFLHTLSHPPQSAVFHGVDVHAEKDAVYYPLVGFQFVAGSAEVLPTIQRASIPLPTKQQHDEVTFGWFSAACPLDVYADDETFGHPPVVVPHEEHELESAPSMQM